MQPYHPNDDSAFAPRKKNRAILPLFKILAVVLIAISILLLIYGLIPHERTSVSDESIQGGCLGCASTIYAKKGDILILDYEVTGGDVNFYLTFDESWRSGNRDYIVKKDHAVDDHREIEIENSGYYYLNFESNDPDSSVSFNVNYSYKLLDKYSPLYIILGVISLVCAFILIIIGGKLKRKPLVVETEYIRI